MIDGQLPPDDPFEAGLQRSEEPSEYTDSYFCATTGLTIVGMAVLRTNALEPLNLASTQLQSARDQRRQRYLLANVGDELDVSHPSHICDDERRNEVVLTRPFTMHDMPNDYLGRIVADHKALHDIALATGLVGLFLTLSGLCEASLDRGQEVTRRHVEASKANNRHSVMPPGMSATRFAQAAAHKALGTPAPGGQMCQSMGLDVGRAGLDR
jgi:hypothetical protein